VVGMGGHQPVGRRRRDAEAGSLVAPRRHPEPLFPPQALDFLAVEVMTLPTQDGVGPPIAPAGMVAGEVPERSAKVPVGVWVLGPVALGRAVLADDLARPPLREAEADLEHVRARRRCDGLTIFPRRSP
jgi:hypothetical protein